MMMVRGRAWALAGAGLLVAAAGCGSHGPVPAAGGVHAVTRQAGGAGGGTVWLDSVQMVSADAGWGLLWTSNPDAATGVPLLPARTSNGGRTWTAVPPPVIRGLVGEPLVLQPVTAARAWLAAVVPVGSGRHVTEVFGTVNGGASWRESAPLPGGQPAVIDFIDPVHGWVLENLGAAMGQEWVALYRSTDAGLHWSLIAGTVPAPQSGTSTSGLTTGCAKDGLVFDSLRTGWITGGCDAGYSVLTTTDAGYRWSPQRLPIPRAACLPAGCSISPPQFVGQAGYLSVGRYPAPGELLVSGDGGASWQPRVLPGGVGQHPQIKFFSTSRAIVVSGGPQGTIGRVFYVTADGGRRWTAVPQGMVFDQAGASVAFISTSDGFAWVTGTDVTAGAAPDMYQTTNSGRTWLSFTPRQA